MYRVIHNNPTRRKVHNKKWSIKVSWSVSQLWRDCGSYPEHRTCQEKNLNIVIDTFTELRKPGTAIQIQNS